MIEFEKAFEIVMKAARPMGMETVPLLQACGRVLREDILSDMDMPPFDKSAMDGYACRAADRDKPLRMVETIAAGQQPQKEIGPGECAKIMTGAMVPQGADCVVMVEHTKQEGDLVHVTKKIDDRSNISSKAEDISVGDRVLSSGIVITPAEIAVLASVGCANVPVARQPRVGIIATGSELVEPDHKPGAVQMRNSNSYQLWAQVLRAGAVPQYFGIAPDERNATDRILKQAMTECDIILLSGGVSMGDFDFVPDILRQNGVKIKFDKVAVKPGKPTVFGVKDSHYVFGLPGNPVSTFVILEVLVRPFLLSLMGATPSPKMVKARLLKPAKRKTSDRVEYRPACLLADGTVHIPAYHGSAHIHAYAKANGMICFPVDVMAFEEGREIEVILLP